MSFWLQCCLSSLYSYQLSWILSSHTNIYRYLLRIREKNLNRNEPQVSQWKHIQIRPQEQDVIGSQHRISGSFLIENLSKSKNYEIDLLVGNDFGVTRSEIFSFSNCSAMDGNGVSFIKLNQIFLFIIIIFNVYYNITLKMFFIWVKLYLNVNIFCSISPEKCRKLSSFSKISYPIEIKLA